MTQTHQIYKCLVCGNIVEVLHTGIGQLVCCGQPMNLENPNTVDASTEKHLPVAEKLPNEGLTCPNQGFLIKIGAEAHPMEEKHFIEWIEVETADGKRGKKFLKPGEQPQADFPTNSKIIKARAYCNMHGLWETEIK